MRIFPEFDNCANFCYNINEFPKGCIERDNSMKHVEKIISSMVDAVWKSEDISWNNAKFHVCNQQLVIREEKDVIIVYLDTAKLVAEELKKNMAIQRLKEEFSKKFEVLDETSPASFEVITLKRK